MEKRGVPDRGMRQNLVKAARVFAPLLDELDLSAEAIDIAIEELRPLRMHIHAIDYGDAPGFRSRSNDELVNK